MYLMIPVLAHKKCPPSPPPNSKNEHGGDSQSGFLCIWDGPGWPFSHDQLCLQQSGPRQPGEPSAVLPHYIMQDVTAAAIS